LPLIAAHTLAPDNSDVQIYNAYDCAITYEVWQNLRPQASQAGPLYAFEIALQAPVLEMMTRGFKVDPTAREKGIYLLRQRLAHLSNYIDTLAEAVWDYKPPVPKDLHYPKPKLLNPDSTTQLIKFFYNTLGIPPILKWHKGESKTPMDRDTLEKLEVYFLARPIVNAILEYRDAAGQLEVLESEVDDDWRMRTTYQIAGTDTTRFSSSKSILGTGRNLQNIEEALRHIFISDEGFKLYGIDLEQAESREVGLMCGLLFDDWTYLDLCESSDLHTAVCQIVWPEFPWTGNQLRDRQIADQNFYREHSYRDATKVLGHGCLTEDHEVLTPLGWVPISEKPSTIMQFDGKESKFVEVSNWTDFDYTGTLHIWEGQSISARMTTDHRIYYTVDAPDNLHVRKVGEVPNSARIPSGWGYVGGDNSITPAITRMIAAYQCDGYIEHGSNQVRFHFHKPRKFERLVKLCENANLDCRISGDKVIVNCAAAHNWHKAAGPYLLNWSKEALEAYLDELPHWDGHFGKTSTSLASKDRDHLDWIRTCNRILGKGGNIQKEQMSGFGTVMYKLQINNRLFASMVSMQCTKEQANSVRVLCPTVSSSAFYIRRKEKISITGNSNYLGQPRTMAVHTKIPLNLCTAFQANYFEGVPAIPRWQQWVASELQTHHRLTNVFGVTRDFFSHPNDDETLRAAVAHGPQSATAQRLNLGMWRLWRHFPEAQLLAQLHDAVYFQVSESIPESVVAKKALKLVEVHQHFRGRNFVVPGAISVGRNWGKYKTGTNPNGLKKIEL
jgi:DNA polymerase I-like protein with 3'-5' exonuclease and polymerase domains